MVDFFAAGVSGSESARNGETMENRKDAKSKQSINPLKPNARRTKRVVLRVPVSAEGTRADKHPFREQTHSITVNANGGLIALASKVEQGQQLVLTNLSTGQTQECRVVYLGPSRAEKKVIGVEFSRSDSNFWHIDFPSFGAKAVPE